MKQVRKKEPKLGENVASWEQMEGNAAEEASGGNV